MSSGHSDRGESASVMTYPTPSLTPDDRDAIVNRIMAYLTLGAPPEETDPAGNPVIYPSAEAVNDAVRFVALLPPRIPLPRVGRADDGEINFVWRGEGVFIDVGVRGDNEIVYFARVERSRIDCDGAASITASSLPRDLAAAIVSIRQ